MPTKEELERIWAVNEYTRGRSPKSICDSIKRPGKWLYKWIHRYETGGQEWFANQPKTPKHSPAKTPPEMTAQIVAARESLEQTLYVYRGVFNIRQKLSDLGVNDVPSDATINRIINAAGLTRKDPPRVKVGTPYPAPVSDQPNDVQQIDLWGPRYLSVGHQCYMLNIIDVARRMPSIHVMSDKAFNSLIPAVALCWQTVGIPRILQSDNSLCAGANIRPGVLSKMLRFCLLVGVEVLFIPFREPWRQGIIEKFNDFADKSFFQVQRFQGLSDMCERAKVFQDHCWYDRRLSALRGRTPSEMFPAAEVRLLPHDFRVPDELGIAAGKISFIRLVRSDHQIDVLGLKFPIDETYYREYVTACLFTDSGQLNVYHQDTQIAGFKLSKCCRSPD